MGNQIFHFKQFSVRHDKCAMKVGTDGVLLGAWTHLEKAQRILDIGCGSGLISLMAAQRNAEASIVGIDIDAAAVEQSRENAINSPWGNRLQFHINDISEYQCDQKFDCIICNPPFFTESTLSPDLQRAVARNSSAMPFDKLISAAKRLICNDGTFNVILPSESRNEFVYNCMSQDLNLLRVCNVRTKESKPVRRIMMSFGCMQTATCKEESLVLMNANGDRSEQYCKLTEAFYLH